MVANLIWAGISKLFLGQSLKGRSGLYTVIKQLQDCVWLAPNESQEKVIAKSVRHFRLQNERDVLLRFQHRTLTIRPLIEELQGSDVPPTLILRYLDDDILNASNKQHLTRPEVKLIAKRVLEALSVLHDEGFVHTDIKPSNVLVNCGQQDVRFTDMQLADFGSTVYVDSIHAQRGDPISTPIFRNGLHIFKLDVLPDHEDYDLKILLKHHRCFGPFPESYEQIVDKQRLAVLVWVMQSSPPETLRPFHLTTTQEICEEDKSFVLRAMKLDPRNRPSAKQLLKDKWFHPP
ncbi:hypothetical protein ASPZODRAFT_155405 [Penicilliopsis zonata CBS 506.65]|uniref:Protein kinase domain-containing protein n=1 Tax=Penicilliopsis zonata CBS 506.65 TaxID=1073090 RepID=A0A1L9S580_9EURO|nr:hypothetical protein ASPZODRAFT_155405 [Penicilliopsis zonata CBS 506.65]OJJ42304.1 hypothetical protein ASPZODRAFT_155405 [Penicilliopsis zonata CBS 506.65]